MQALPAKQNNRSPFDNVLLMIFPLTKTWKQLEPAKQYAESVAHTSLGLRPRHPRDTPTDSTLKACHIDTKEDFHRKT